MIFARRALQSRLDALRQVLAGVVVDELARRFNRPGKDRLAAMWEVVVLHGLSRHGTIQNEEPLPSGRRPDVRLEDRQLHFTADITTVSDEGLDAANPFSELIDLIEKQKSKLKLPIGGLDLKVKPKKVETKRGVRTVLRLPPRNQLETFVATEIIPRLREQIAAGRTILQIEFEDDKVGLTLTIDPSKAPISSGNFAAYDIPTIKDLNPVYSALKAKADQLRGAKGLTGVIVGDGDCAALADRRGLTRARITPQAIADEFLRQYSSVDFVLYLTIEEKRHGWMSATPPERLVRPLLVVRTGCAAKVQLEALFTSLISEIPKPVQMPVNGAMRAREPGYQLGHYGGYSMTGNKIQMSAREFVETLAGIRTLADNGAKNIEASRKMPPEHSRLQSVFLRQLKEGRLPSAITVIKTDSDDSDDWIEFEFGDPDPAISPLR